MRALLRGAASVVNRSNALASASRPARTVINPRRRAPSVAIEPIGSLMNRHAQWLAQGTGKALLLVSAWLFLVLRQSQRQLIVLLSSAIEERSPELRHHVAPLGNLQARQDAIRRHAGWCDAIQIFDHRQRQAAQGQRVEEHQARSAAHTPAGWCRRKASRC